MKKAKKGSKPSKPRRSQRNRQPKSVRRRAKVKAVAKALPNLPRLRAVFALRKLEGQLSSDVISDGSIAAKFEIPTHKPANLGPDITVHQDRLLTAFRDVLAGKRVTAIVDENGKRLQVKVSVAENGTARIVVNKMGFAFTHAGLLSPDRDSRRAFLDRYLKEQSLANVYADELRSLVSKQAMTDEDFATAVGILSGSPESFVQSIKAKVTVRDLSNADLMPENEQHWDNLVAPRRNSETLEEFLRVECEEQRARAFHENPVSAYFASSLSWCAPSLVPVDKIQALPADVTLNLVERTSSLSDHFAVTGTFEICADRLVADARFEAAGTKLLDQLFGDMQQLLERCTFFAAIFTLTLVRLAQHHYLRRKPPFWRRITAAANASLVTRACGADNAEKLFEWVVEHSGKPFLFSTLLEEVSEPRWKPEWASGNHLIADAFGRVDAALKKMPEATRPAAWGARIEKAREWIIEKHFELFAILPAIGESARCRQPTLEETLGFHDSFQKLCDEPTVDALIDCTPGIYVLGVPKEVAIACHTVLAHLQKTSARLTDTNAKFALQLLSYIAVLVQDEALADAIGQFALEKVRELKNDESTVEIILRLVECSSAYADRTKAADTLARRLESVSFLAKLSASVDLHDSLKQLQLLEGLLSQRLGRALAAARLARSAA
ncbi:MAG: hypothetical protein K9G60_05550 [Pseudolabrys sp.]|nr:hypothetical protein [Pseudolabrys sp.]